MSKSLFDDVFGKDGVFESIFGTASSEKRTALPPKTETPPQLATVSRFKDFRSAKFKLDDNSKRICVYCKKRVELINHVDNSKAAFGDLWLIIRDATLKPKSGWAFDLVHPNYSNLSLYIGKAVEGDEDLLKTYLYLKSQLKV